MLINIKNIGLIPKFAVKRTFREISSEELRSIEQIPLS